MAKYKRIKGGERNEKTGVDWTRPELEKICDLYIELGGKGIHENNSKIHSLAMQLGRTVRSVENQLLGFKKVATKEVGRKNYNRLIPLIWKKKTEKIKKKKVTNNFRFRISSALKDIIGQDLITDDYIAVFELVKNSYDAYATRVDIYFENIYAENSKIIIKDNGKGMDAEDLKEKWLFVAYSAKKEGTEDDSFDYRDNIYKRRAFAGAKGIGRFSCDRLGRILYLETTKKASKAKTEVLITDWGKFEEDSTEEFVDIGIEHFQKRKSGYGLDYGTVLEISDLRSDWNRHKLLRLKSSLAKLINPNRGKGEHTFKIYIYAEDEKENDTQEADEKDKINGEVKNFIFEELGLKTTKIYSSISEDGKFIDTELIDGGTLIYRIKEENKFPLLDNIDITLYYLNKPAKLTFITRMGVPSIEYGHVFLYKNSFRIYPYGEPGEDPLGIDARKTQGVRRYFGTRELIGQIEIFSDTDQLKETSSRGDGLKKTDTYSLLEDFFWFVLKRLERYVVQVQKWGLGIESDESETMNEAIIKLIAYISNSDSIIEFECPENLFEIIEKNQSKSAGQVIKNLRRIALESDNNSLLKEVENTAKKLKEIQKEKEEAEKESEQERQKALEAKKELEQKISENLFLKSVKSQDLDEVVSFMHSIGISSSTIDNYLSATYQKLNRNIPLSEARLKKIIQTVSFENRKILSISRFGTKANFKLYAEETFIDIVEYITEYAINILTPLRKEDINIEVYNNNSISYKKNVRPIELAIVLDNFLNNSVRAKSKNFIIEFSKNKDIPLIVSFKDDGKGVPDTNLSKLFDFGFTTTSGSGLGLYHVKEILTRLSCEIEVNNKVEKGVQFILNFK
jgi:signal transduction histidine kinase